MATDVVSKYYELGDFVYAKDFRTNAWFAGQIVQMIKNPVAIYSTEVSHDDGILYGIKFLGSNDMLLLRLNDIFNNCTKCYIDQLNIGDVVLLPYCSLYPSTSIKYLYEGTVVKLNLWKSPQYVKLLLLNNPRNDIKFVCIAATTFIRMNTSEQLIIDSKSKDERCTLQHIKEDTVTDENYICEECSQKILHIGDRLACVRCKQMFHQYCLTEHITQKTLEINWICMNCEEKEESVSDTIIIDVTGECVQASFSKGSEVVTTPLPLKTSGKKKKNCINNIPNDYIEPAAMENEVITTKSPPIMKQKKKYGLKEKLHSKDISRNYCIPFLEENEHVTARSSLLKKSRIINKIRIRRGTTYYIISPSEKNKHTTMGSLSLKKRSIMNKIHISCIPRYHIVSPTKKSKLVKTTPSENKARKIGMMKRTCISSFPKDYIGPIPGIKVGTTWKYRFQLSEAGIHLPLIAGIHGSWKKSACSIVFSGVYKGDKDFGDSFLYSGCGGKIENGKKKLYCDQILEKSNRSLALNCNAPLNSVVGSEAADWKGGIPVRVVRSSKLKSQYAPKEGYRYDGIYKVVRYFPEIESHGYRVWRYELKRDDPEPSPWTVNRTKESTENRQHFSDLTNESSNVD